MANVIFEIVLIIILIVLTGILSMAELAVVSTKKAKLEKALILNRIRAFLFVWGEAEYSVSEKYARCKFRVLLGASEKAPETHNNRNSPR